MKVLVISNMYPSDRYPIYGAFVARQVESLRAAGVDIEVVANRERESGPLTNLVKYARLVARSRRALRRGPFDLIHAHYLYPTAVIAAWVSRRAHAPLVLTAHGDDVENAARSRLAGRVAGALTTAAAVVAVSNHLADLLVERFGVDRDSIEVIDCGVDTELFRPMEKADARLLVDLPAETKVVLYAGHLSEAKGVRTVIGAHRKLVAEGLNALLVVIGDGPLAGEVAGAAREPQVKGLVRAEGEVRHSDMPHWFAAADVVCVPSHREGLGLVALEAMACGTPVVASDVGGLAEIVSDGRNGLLVPPADPDRMAGAIGRLLDGATASKMGEAARRTAAGHSLGTQAAKLAALYGSIASP